MTSQVHTRQVALTKPQPKAKSKAPAANTPVPNNKARWIKANITYRDMTGLGAGLPLAAHLYTAGGAIAVYFARYTKPPFRIEMQMLTNLHMAELRKIILGFKHNNSKASNVMFKECNGSLAHAQACTIAMTLQDEGKLSMSSLIDICHWTYNMAGFSYAQEASACSIEAFNAMRNLPSWCEHPIFGKTQAPAVVQRNSPLIKPVVKGKLQKIANKTVNRPYTAAPKPKKPKVVRPARGPYISPLEDTGR